ncbi:hypothetical protein EJB05_17460, partial [Eragrostis curvula]
MPFVRRRGWRARTVREALEGNSWTRDIVGRLPLWDVIRVITLNPQERDHHTWLPDPSSQFSSRSAYERYFIGGITFEPHKRLWKTCKWTKTSNMS